MHSFFSKDSSGKLRVLSADVGSMPKIPQKLSNDERKKYALQKNYKNCSSIDICAFRFRMSQDLESTFQYNGDYQSLKPKPTNQDLYKPLNLWFKPMMSRTAAEQFLSDKVISMGQFALLL